MELVGWEHQRTNSIVNWLEQYLTFLELFDLYQSEIASWRAHYTVEKSEKYLLMVNLAGVVSARLGDFPRTPGQLFHNMDPKGFEKAQQIVSQLGVVDGNIDAFGVSGCMIGRNGLALIGNEIVDIWAMRVQGQSCETITDYLWQIRAQLRVD